MTTVESHDLLPVHSRVSWSAVIAGAVVALGVYLLLSVLGVALGLSISGQVGDRELGIGAIVWSVLATLLAFFLGGFVTTQCTAGENKSEAIVYGVLLWGSVFAVLLALMAGGIRLGFNAVMGVASSQLTETTARVSNEDLQAAGFTNEQIASMRTQFDRLRDPAAVSQDVRSAAQDPRTVQAAWWAFAGMVLSLLVAIGGAVAGSGPNILLASIGMGSIFMSRERTHQPVGR